MTMAPPAGQAASYPTAMAPPPAGQAALYTMTTAPPPDYPAGQQPPIFPPHRAPAALGAPPGEEAFPPQAPPVPADEFTQSEGSVFTESSLSDWSTRIRHRRPGRVVGDFRGPSIMDQEATLGLKHLSEEAEALLLRYLKEFYAVQPDAAEQQPHVSLLFRTGAEPDPGIPLTADFKREYERIAQGLERKGTQTNILRRSFRFQPGVMDKFLSPEKLSPEVLALGDHGAHGNPLRRKQFSEEDRRWTAMSSLTRSSRRLAAYAGALTNLAVQADDLHVSREDRMLLNSLLLSISEVMLRQATKASLYTTHRRRDLALTALGFL